MAAISGLPLLLSLVRAVLGLVAGVKANQTRSLRFALGAFVLGALPWVIIVFFFVGVSASTRELRMRKENQPTLEGSTKCGTDPGADGTTRT